MRLQGYDLYTWTQTCGLDTWHQAGTRLQGKETLSSYAACLWLEGLAAAAIADLEEQWCQVS